jgi:hypothetical protein
VKVCGLLSFFDESAHWLATAVSGMARVCDLIVAHDGAYQLYPGARPRSHPQQSEAIIQAAEAADVGCLVYRPKDIYFGNEVEKRNEGLKIAGSLLTEEDWVLIFDADYHILKCNPDMVRHELEQTEHRVATYTLLDGRDFQSEPNLAQYANGRPVDTEWTCLTRDVYRWHPSLAVGPLHWAYSSMVDGKKQWLRGPWTDGRLAPALDLRANLVVYHRTQDRTQVRRDTAHAYYKMREQYNTEPLLECALIAAEEDAA